MADINLRGYLCDNDTADVYRYWGWRDITCPSDIADALKAADGENVTVLINSPGGDMTVGMEIRSILRRYKGKTIALFQGYGASSATLAASGCTEIHSEPGALLCYHNPTGGAHGDYQELGNAAESLRNARDCILEVYRARKSSKSAEDLAELMDKDIFITPTQAVEYGLVDKVLDLTDGAEPGPVFAAAVGGAPRITNAMREKYQAHVAAEKEAQANKDEASRALARIRALANY